MRMKLALLLAVLAVLLSGCSYMLVEESPVQVGSPSIQLEVSGR